MIAALALPALTGCLSTGSEKAAGNDVVYSAGKPAATVYAPADRHTAPVLSGPTITGGAADTASYRGRVLVVNFWAHWCDPCRDEAPALAKVAEDAELGRSVSFLGVDIEDDNPSAVAFGKQYGTGVFPSLVDRDRALMARFDGLALAPPQTLVIDRQGRIAAKFSGPVSEDGLRQVLNRVTTEAA
jgi:thiol-disulfide isomerase/thioredoxin